MAHFQLRSLFLVAFLMTMQSMLQAAAAEEAAATREGSEGTKPPSLRGTMTAGSGLETEQQLSVLSAVASAVASSSAVEGDFCVNRSPGWACSGFTRVRCCEYSWGIALCDSEEHYRGCGWRN